MDHQIFPGMWVRAAIGGPGHNALNGRAGRVMRLTETNEAVIKFDAWPMPMQVAVSALTPEGLA
jgi:hypothetical protein